MQEEGITWALGEGLLWSGVLVPLLARNFPPVAGRDLKKTPTNPKPLKMGLYVSFLCLYAGGDWFPSEADLIGHFACRGAGWL